MLHATRKFILALAVSTATPFVSMAADTSWVGGTDGVWSTASNWSGNAVPHNNGATTYNVLVDGNAATNSVVHVQHPSIRSTFTVDSLTIGAGDKVIIEDTFRLQVRNTLSNGGTIVVAGGTEFTTLDVGSLSLTGGGTILLMATALPASSNIRSIGQNSRFTNVNNTIIGDGRLGGDQVMAITNQGTVIADANHTLSVHPGFATSNVNSGYIRANGGTLSLRGAWDNAAGTFEALNNSTFIISGAASISGGTLLTSGTGVIQVFSPSQTTSFTAPMRLAGRLHVQAGTLALQGIAFNATGSTLQIATGATLTTGSNTTVSGSPAVELDGTWSTSGSKVTLGGVSGAGTLITNAPVSVQHLRIGTLSLSTTTLSITGGGGNAGTSRLNALPSLNGNSKLDVNDHDLVLDYAAASPISLEAVRTMLAGGYAAGAWNGTGIVSSSAKNSPASARTALGYRLSSDTVGLAGGTFSGLDIDDSAILIKYTLAGDANLDGAVNVTDLALLAAGWEQSGHWTDGDFNYDGTTNSIDLGLLALNWHNSASGAPGLEILTAALGLPTTAIPEPASLTAALAGAFAFSRRQRRA